MTPAQKVALDAMRSAWPEEVVQRMLRAEDGKIESAVKRFHRYYVGDLRHLLRERIGPRRAREVNRAVNREWEEIWDQIIESAGRIPALPPFSTPESAPGASTPQPPGETA